MAYDADTYEQIRRATGSWGDPSVEDEFFDRFLDDTNGDVNAAAALVWQEKAASYAEMVDISEAGSSRKNSQLYAAAMDMFKRYSAMADEDAVDTANFSTTRRIIRA